MIVVKCLDDKKGEIEIDVKALDCALLDGLNLHRAVLENENLSNSSFKETDLRGAFLSGANLSNSNFTGASLITAFFDNAILDGVNLTNAMLIGACFEKASFIGADFSGANVEGATFNEAILVGANMETCLGLETTNLNGAIYDSTTSWPLGFNAEQYGATLSKRSL